MPDVSLDMEAVEAAARALFEKHSSLDSWSWDEETEGVKDIFRGKAQAAIAAYLSALWKPIETAPRDRMVLIQNSGWGAERVCIACRRDYAESGFVNSLAVPIPVSWKPVMWADIPQFDANAAAGGGDG